MHYGMKQQGAHNIVNHVIEQVSGIFKYAEWPAACLLCQAVQVGCAAGANATAEDEWAVAVVDQHPVRLINNGVVEGAV